MPFLAIKQLGGWAHRVRFQINLTNISHQRLFPFLLLVQNFCHYLLIYVLKYRLTRGLCPKRSLKTWVLFSSTPDCSFRYITSPEGKVMTDVHRTGRRTEFPLEDSTSFTKGVELKQLLVLKRRTMRMRTGRVGWLMFEAHNRGTRTAPPPLLILWEPSTLHFHINSFIPEPSLFPKAT